jgi:hypothetical protein
VCILTGRSDRLGNRRMLLPFATDSASASASASASQFCLLQHMQAVCVAPPTGGQTAATFGHLFQRSRSSGCCRVPVSCLTMRLVTSHSQSLSGHILQHRPHCFLFAFVSDRQKGKSYSSPNPVTHRTRTVRSHPAYQAHCSSSGTSARRSARTRLSFGKLSATTEL